MLQLRPLNTSDASLLSGIHAASMEISWDETAFFSLLQTPSYKGWLALKNTQPAGFILVSYLPPDAEILTFAILPEWRRQSIGRTLLRHFLNECSPVIRSIFLEVDQTNSAAIRLYKEQGFKTVGSRKNYYQHTDGLMTDAMVMQLKIDAEP